MNDEKPNYAGLILIGVVGYWLVTSMGGSAPGPDPGPKPSPAISSEMDVANSEATEALRSHIRDVLKKLESGELTDERETRDLLAAGVKAARDAAWQPIKERDAAAFVDGWTVEKQIRRLKTMINERAE